MMAQAQAFAIHASLPASVDGIALRSNDRASVGRVLVTSKRTLGSLVNRVILGTKGGLHVHKDTRASALLCTAGPFMGSLVHGSCFLLGRHGGWREECLHPKCIRTRPLHFMCEMAT